MSDKRPFHGEGRDKSPLTEVENARHRHMFESVERDYPLLNGFAEMLRSGKRVAAFIAIMAALGAAVSWASERGLF